jgi:16S rRNA (guanine966-N2)-methyltransferase
VRISGGQFKGRKIATQKVFSKKKNGDEVRPTSSKVREALFDILKSKMDGATFLDLFAGTGTVGFEALSRGAATTCFVEGDHIRSQAIRDFITRIGLEERAVVYTKHALDFLKDSVRTGMTFDIIFADPPYASGEIEKILPLLDESQVLNEGGCLMVEHSSRSALQNVLPSLKFIKNYRYGDTMLTLYRKEK